VLGHSRFFNFLIYTQSVGLLERGISLSQGLYLHTKHKHKHRINPHTHIPVSSGIRTHDPSVRASEDVSCLGPRGAEKGFFLCEAIGTAATPRLLCQPRVTMKMIVEKQKECRLCRGNKSKFSEKTCPSATFVS
jgi:hypothetical protein